MTGPDREPPTNLADNLLRDFEERWWKHCKEVRSAEDKYNFACVSASFLCSRTVIRCAQGDEGAMRKLLASSGRVLAHVVDENRRR